MWRLSMGKNRSLSAGLPASITRSRIKPLRPVVRLSLWPYSTSRLPLTMMSALEQADDLFVGGDLFATKNSTLGLGELRGKVGDGVSQAADFISAASSIPS